MKEEWRLNIEGTHTKKLSHNDQMNWIRNIGHNSLLEDWLTVKNPTTQVECRNPTFLSFDYFVGFKGRCDWRYSQI